MNGSFPELYLNKCSDKKAHMLIFQSMPKEVSDSGKNYGIDSQYLMWPMRYEN
jgi:hypothetical protein